MQSNKININIFIAIYFGGDSVRYNLTEIIFKHYHNIKQIFAERANFRFTIVGSDGEISKKLTLKYFSEDEYFEFNQNHPKYGKYKLGYDKKFLRMLSNKINTGIRLASRHNDDIIFWAGSNDFISSNFFEQVIEYYDPNKKQLFGITNYENGNNVNLYSEYGGVSEDLIINDSKEHFWWNGTHPYERIIYKYIGCIIGVNNTLYNNHKDIFDIWKYDEGKIEKYIRDLDNVDMFYSKNVFSWNIKTLSKNDITPYESLKAHYEKMKYIMDEIMCLTDFTNNEIKYVFELSLNIDGE